MPAVHGVDYIANGLLPDGALVESSASVYELLAAAGHAITQGVAHLSAVVAGVSIARQLSVARGAALMRIEQIDTDARSCPVVYSVEHHRPDAFDIVLHPRGPTASSAVLRGSSWVVVRSRRWGH